MNTPALLSIPQQQLEQAGAARTAREIAQQPGLWRRIAASGIEGTQRFLEPLLRRPELQIVLTGAGTSAYIGECLAPALTRRMGARVRAIATTDLVADPDGVLGRAPLLLVSFARSGNSPESVAAQALAEQISGECHHLIVSCNPRGALCRRAEQLRNACIMRLPEECNDQAFAMTSSFSGMMLAAALAFGVLPPLQVAKLAQWAEQVLSGRPSADELARAGYRRVVYLGDRELRGLAREAALKLMELTDGRVVATAWTPLEFRHGPKSIIDAHTLVVLLMCNNPYTRAYQLDLLRELRRDAVAARVVAVSTDGAAPDLPLRDAATASDLELCFPYAVFAQCFALQASLALNLRPDAPNERGTVNREVQGVSVYPWRPVP